MALVFAPRNLTNGKQQSILFGSFYSAKRRITALASGQIEKFHACVFWILANAGRFQAIRMQNIKKMASSRYRCIVKSIVLLFAATALYGAEGNDPDQSDKSIGLHSDGGAWQFYRQAQKDDLPRVLLIGDSILNGYRDRVVDALEGKAVVDCWLTPLHLNSPDLHHDLRKVLEQGPYDVVHFNIGLHGWTPGRIPPGQYEPLLRKYVELLKSHSKSSRLIWASSTPITVKDKPTELDPVHNKTIADRNAIAARVMPTYGIADNDH